MKTSKKQQWPPFEHLNGLPNFKHNKNFPQIFQTVNLNHFLKPIIRYNYCNPNEVDLEKSRKTVWFWAKQDPISSVFWVQKQCSLKL